MNARIHAPEFPAHLSCLNTKQPLQRKQLRLHEPEGLAARSGRLFIADTNNHRIRVAELAAETLQTLELGDSGL